MKSGIYTIKNTVNGKCYVGSTKCFTRREKEHFKLLRNNKHWNVKLQRSFNIHGEVFQFIPVEALDYEKLVILEAEDRWIATLNSKANGYNIASASFGDQLTHHPNRQEIIAKISRSVRLKCDSMTQEERNEKWGKSGAANGIFGKPRPRYVIDAMLKGTSDFVAVNGHGPTYGIIKSDTHRQKISAHAATRLGDRNSFFGKTHSPETLAVISSKAKNRPCKTLHPIIVNEVRYVRLKDAEAATGIKGTTLWHRAKSKNPKFKDTYFEDTPK